MTASQTGPVAALIVAGGRGIRAGGDVPKQYRKLLGKSMLSRSIRPFLEHTNVDRVVAVIHPNDRDFYNDGVPDHDKLGAPVAGGADRQASVRLGLEALASTPPELVLIHDAARPFVRAVVIDRMIEAVRKTGAALPATAIADTLKRASSDGTVEATVPRAGLYRAQTPQGFDFKQILSAHKRAAADGGSFTDDAAIAEFAGLKVTIVDGDPENTKITSNEDFQLAERRLAAISETRVGSGYDVHALGPGTTIMLGGVAIDHDRSLIGHSDADVVLHAITDAILGALAEEDIGTHFPPGDASLKGTASDRFLADATTRVAVRGGSIIHLDATIIAEAPQIGPHREEMRRRIASICGVDSGRVSIKATTNERLGFVGRSEGIAAMATATVTLPSDES